MKNLNLYSAVRKNLYGDQTALKRFLFEDTIWLKISVPFFIYVSQRTAGFRKLIIMAELQLKTKQDKYKMIRQ